MTEQFPLMMQPIEVCSEEEAANENFVRTKEWFQFTVIHFVCTVSLVFLLNYREVLFYILRVIHIQARIEIVSQACYFLFPQEFNLNTLKFMQMNNMNLLIFFASLNNIHIHEPRRMTKAQTHRFCLLMVCRQYLFIFLFHSHSTELNKCYR